MRAAGRSTAHRILKSATIHVWTVLLACIAGMASAPANDLSGVWEAARHFGPALRGPLLVTRDKSNWTAEIAGQRASATIEGAAVHLTFSAERGEFRGNARCQDERNSRPLDSAGYRQRWIALRFSGHVEA